MNIIREGNERLILYECLKNIMYSHVIYSKHIFFYRLTQSSIGSEWKSDKFWVGATALGKVFDKKNAKQNYYWLNHGKYLKDTWEGGWCKNQPDFTNKNEFCMEINYQVGKSWGWNDSGCGKGLNFYICESLISLV